MARAHLLIDTHLLTCYYTGQFDKAQLAVFISMWQEASDTFCKVTRVYEPRPENVAIYADLYEVCKDIPTAPFPAWDKRKAFLVKHGFEG